MRNVLAWLFPLLVACPRPLPQPPGTPSPDASVTTETDAGETLDGGVEDAGPLPDGSVSVVTDAGVDAGPACNPCLEVRPGFPITLPESPARFGALATAKVAMAGPREFVVVMDAQTHETASLARVNLSGVMQQSQYPGGAAPSGGVVVDVSLDGIDDVVWGDFTASLRAHPFVGVVSGFPRTVGPAAPLQGVMLTHDNTLNDDVLTFALNANLFRHLVHGGSVDGWPVQAATTGVIEGVVACQLGGDSAFEMAGVISEAGLRIAAFDRTGALLTGFPTTELVGDAPYPPTCVDLDANGVDEIAHVDGAGTLRVFNATGAMRDGFPVSVGAGVTTQVSAGDLTGDGRPELVGGMQGSGGSVFAVDGNGQVVTGFPAAVGGAFSTTALLADVDGDDRADVLGVTQAGTLTGVLSTGMRIPGVTLELGAAPVGAPLVEDLDGDGRWEIAVALVTSRLVVTSLTAGSAHPEHAPWTRYRGHNDRSSRYAGETFVP